ncbi:MAG: hypothetical protein WC055_10020 [Melioribacteraceae bacterium]
MWDPKLYQFGIIKIDGNNIKLYHSRDNYTQLNVGEKVTNAIWAGDHLNVTLASGKVRRYKSRDSYQTI